MTIDTASAVEVQHPLRGSDEHDQALLVITDDRHHGHDSLSTPFAEAVVLEVGPDPDEVVIEGLFDTIVIERSNVDPQWLGAVNARLQAALRPDGQLLVALDPVGPAADAETATVALAGLQWHGLRAFSGSPCAVLRRGAPETTAVATGALLATAEAAVRLTTAGTAHSTTRITVGEARAVVGQYLEDQRRSEHALLKHLDSLALELEKERESRKQDQTLKGVLRMTPQGRKVLGAARKARNLARKAKRKVKRTLRHR
ncbi:hypothetical protein [Micromonospora mirobrigensis]|uniref:Uncharacterized protein n=1 Tax=Micromonospora mirobrigensis TaxID=262898 RepID=A0A1C4UGT2_9ACTN|nr:hypothetical protein [Micromonospora mirobrigensis]SCE70894.1 hypothetical protein GA0070564_101465 [Micromonospora mirobrigensis]